MALIVQVKVNQDTIIRTVAQRISGNPGEWCTYEIDGGPDTIEHYYDAGAEALAIKMLERLKQP